MCFTSEWKVTKRILESEASANDDEVVDNSEVQA